MGRINITNKRKTIFIIIAVIVVAGVAGYMYISSKNSSSNAKTQITNVKAGKGNIVSGLATSGQIETANYLAVTTSVNGIVKKVFVKEGDKVVKGQSIMEVTLDSEGEKSRLSAYASYLGAKNSLESAKTSLYTLDSALVEMKEAFDTEKEANSYQTHDERISYKLAENNYIVAKANLDAKKADISKLEISLSTAWSDYEAQAPTVTAPSDGIISNIVAVEGTAISNSVTSDRSVFTVASIKKEGTPIAALNITEMDINKVKVGQKVYLTLNSIADKVFNGRIVGIDKIGTTASGVSNYPVTVKFDESSDAVLPNMSVEGEVVIEEKNDVLLIPSSAVSSRRNKSTVTVVSGNVKKEVEVVTGISDGSYTEIISGLNEGDEVQVSSLPVSGFSTQSTDNRRGGFGVLGPGEMH
jgi:RND family efflux transporter MFP subunit